MLRFLQHNQHLDEIGRDLRISRISRQTYGGSGTWDVRPEGEVSGFHEGEENKAVNRIEKTNDKEFTYVEKTEGGELLAEIKFTKTAEPRTRSRRRSQD